MTARSQSRKHRGYATQRLIANRWREKGLFPYAKAIGAGEQGNDVQDTPGLAVEIKARTSVSLVASLKQAAAGIRADRGWEIPVVIWRHDGQGESAMDDWTVTMRLEDFEGLMADRQAQDSRGC